MLGENAIVLCDHFTTGPYSTVSYTVPWHNINVKIAKIAFSVFFTLPGYYGNQ